MRLATYIAERKISVPEMAARVGVTRQALWRYVNGLRIPRTEVMRAIVDETEGHVTPADFYAEPTASKEAAA